MNNNTAILAGLAIAGLALSKRGKAAPNGVDPANIPPPVTGGPDVNPSDVAGAMTNALRQVVAQYGVDVARNVERIYRLETRNFESGQFRATNTAGMRTWAASYPWGWSLTQAGLIPSDFGEPVTMAENAGGSPVKWVVFLSLPKAVLYLAFFLNKYGNNAGRWRSTRADQQAAYIAALSLIPTPLVDNLV